MSCLPIRESRRYAADARSRETQHTRPSRRLQTPCSFCAPQRRREKGDLWGGARRLGGECSPKRTLATPPARYATAVPLTRATSTEDRMDDCRAAPAPTLPIARSPSSSTTSSHATREAR
ncbi:hypothetical protein K523DRAFT_148897 [Schizophyllum commune Tattone D]|nr:hypothetical protein K523DRAFT_148897 [Schizophyllum commune Tattone D]